VQEKKMSAVSGFSRAKLLGLETHNPEQARQAAEHYLKEVADQDERRLMWVVESAANAAADDITEQEDTVARHTNFNRDQEAAAAQQRLDRLTQDFRFLWAMQTLLRERSFQRSAADFAGFLKMQKKRNV
jgi:hypothetical protein